MDDERTHDETVTDDDNATTLHVTMPTIYHACDCPTFETALTVVERLAYAINDAYHNNGDLRTPLTLAMTDINDALTVPHDAHDAP